MSARLEHLAQQLQSIADVYPEGAKALGLLVVGRQLVERFMNRPGVSPDECHAFLRDVNALFEEIEP